MNIKEWFIDLLRDIVERHEEKAYEPVEHVVGQIYFVDEGKEYDEGESGDGSFEKPFNNFSSAQAATIRGNHDRIMIMPNNKVITV